MKSNSKDIKEEDVKPLGFCRKCEKNQMMEPIRIADGKNRRTEYRFICLKCGTRAPNRISFLIYILKFGAFSIYALIIFGIIYFIFFPDMPWLLSLNPIRILLKAFSLFVAIFIPWLLWKEMKNYQRMKEYADWNFQKIVKK